MLHIVLSKSDDTYQKNIINFLKKKFKPLNVKYTFVFVSKHIIETEIEHINQNDYILWHPLVAYNNLNLVRKYRFSIVILQNRSLLVQKISASNPINENMAINNGFYLMYIDETYSDVTNNEWKLVIEDENYIISFEKFKSLLAKDLHSNFKDDGEMLKLSILDLMDNTSKEKVTPVLTQINFS